MADMRVLRVTGKGQLKVKPDVTRITITLNGIKKDYAKTLELSAKDTQILKTVLKSFGFESEDVKTLRFDVNSEYERYRERDEWKQRFVGYKYEHVLKIEFDSDNDRLGTIVYALANNDSIMPEFDAGAPGMTVEYDGETWTLPVGESTCFGLVLPHGDSTLTLHGSGSLTVKYREGAL